MLFFLSLSYSSASRFRTWRDKAIGLARKHLLQETSGILRVSLAALAILVGMLTDVPVAHQLVAIAKVTRE